jgi:hypothetical protein
MDAVVLHLRICRVRGNKLREVEGGAAWYASRSEAVGLGHVVPSSLQLILSPNLPFPFSFSQKHLGQVRCVDVCGDLGFP